MWSGFACLQVCSKSHKFKPYQHNSGRKQVERTTRTEPRADKVAVVEEVTQWLSDSDVVLLTEYRGLNVDQLAELRGALIDAEATYKIYKNSLVRRAAQGKTPDEFVELLVGPTALAFSSKDPSGVAKALTKFATKNDALIIKGGILSDTFIDAKQIDEMAKLPARDEVLAKLAGGFAAPLSAVASLMTNILSEVSGLLNAFVAERPAEPEPEVELAAEAVAEPASEEATAAADPEAIDPEANEKATEEANEPKSTNSSESGEQTQ